MNLQVCRLLVFMTFLFPSFSSFAEQDYSSVNISAPITIVGNELGLRVETNLFGEASLAVEGIYVPAGEEYGKKQQEEENVSLIAGGYEVAAGLSRYSRANVMAGFYWTLGAGYRFLNIAYENEPNDEYRYLYTSFSQNEEGRLEHKLSASGATLRGRIGYRYAADSMPLHCGAYFGLRHFEGQYKDSGSDDIPETSPKDRQELRHQLMTRPEIGIDFGFSF